MSLPPYPGPPHGKTPPHGQNPKRGAWVSRGAVMAVALAACSVLGAGGLWLSRVGDGSRPAARATAVPRASARPAVAKSKPAAPSQEPAAPSQEYEPTTVATVLRTVPRYARPGVRESGTVPSSWWYRPSELPVIKTSPGWVEVRLAQRPNQSTAWLPAKDVTLSTTPFRIVINLATTHLSLYDWGQLVLTAPAGVGAPGDPTPTGDFFVAFDEQPPQPNPGYGPFIMVTSAHSPAISDWEGSGDAVIGIHGPLGDDSEIGTTGARISHGCIRLHDTALVRLSEVPPGTPVDIIR